MTTDENKKPSSGMKPSAGAKTTGKLRSLFSDPKTVYLIRHGESQAQEFSLERRSREKSLRDCKLTERGEEQALVLPSVLGLDRYREIDCVISSPATRAVQTSVIGFPSKPILINYDLAEIGRDKTPLPENCGQPMAHVLADVAGEAQIDTDTFAPPHRPYPSSHENLPRAVRKSKLPKVWDSIWEYCERENADHVAVVCHYNVIRFSLGQEQMDIKPKNATPIECRLHAGGFLEPVETHSNVVQDMTDALADMKKRNHWCMQMLSMDQNRIA